MSFIDYTYFINDVYLPVIGDADGQTVMTESITRYENEVLTCLLGYELLKELKADLDENGIPQTQKFIDLVDGKEFSFILDGYTINTKWEGLANTIKTSLIAYYVYYKYRNNTETLTTTTGEAKNSKENATVMNPFPKLVYSWNEMIKLYGETPRQYRNPVSFKQYWGEYNYRFDYAYNYDLFWRNIDNYIHFNSNPSAYNFLLANKANYTTWIFKPQYKLNVFGF